MNAPAPSRRRFLQHSGLLGTLLACGWLRPGQVSAATAWNDAAFLATDPRQVLEQLQAAALAADPRLQIDAPEVAENGASVAIALRSSAADTRRLSLLIDKNPQPLACQFDFAPGVRASVQLKIRMAESSRVQAVAETATGRLRNERAIVVTIGGCG